MNGGKLVIGIETDTKSFDAQIEATRRKLELLEKSADESKIPEQFKRSKDETIALNKEIEQTRNELLRLQNAQRQNNQEDTKSWKQRTQSLKQFALGLIGIRGIYSIVRKASSTWLSQDTELAKKFQNMWLVIGAALQPVLEALANVFMKLIGYLNVFVKAFTGGKVDLIAKANAQALKKQSDAMKELKNQTYGFDELNIQQTNQSSGSSGGYGGIVEPELNEKVANVIGKIGERLGKISKWVEDNLGTNGPITLGIAGVLGYKLLGGGGAGLLGILATLTAIMLAMEWIETQEIFKTNREGMNDYNEKIKTTTKNYNDLAEAGELTDKQTKQWEKDLKTLNQGIGAHSESLQKNQSDVYGLLAGQSQLLIETKNITDSYEAMANTVGLSEEATQGYIEALENQKTVMENLGVNTTDVDLKIKTLKDNMKNLDKSKANPEIKYTVTNEDKTKPITMKVNASISSAASQVLAAVNTVVGGGSPAALVAQALKNVINISKASFGLATGGILHKSALGSIINNPGRGVYLGSNTIGGEAGREGVIPLTDPNAMTELGETIGRYITVNLTNITKLDSKTINRENRKIGNDMEFIRNGGGA